MSAHHVPSRRPLQCLARSVLLVAQAPEHRQRRLGVGFAKLPLGNLARLARSSATVSVSSSMCRPGLLTRHRRRPTQGRPSVHAEP